MNECIVCCLNTFSYSFSSMNIFYSAIPVQLLRKLPKNPMNWIHKNKIANSCTVGVYVNIYEDRQVYCNMRTTCTCDILSIPGNELELLKNSADMFFLLSSSSSRSTNSTHRHNWFMYRYTIISLKRKIITNDRRVTGKVIGKNYLLLLSDIITEVHYDKQESQFAWK